MPVQGPQASPSARPLLPTQLCLSRQKDLPLHPQRNLEAGEDRTFELQNVQKTYRPVDWASPSGRPGERKTDHLNRVGQARTFHSPVNKYRGEWILNNESQ